MLRRLSGKSPLSRAKFDSLLTKVLSHSRLTSIVVKRNAPPSKLDEVKIKLNILSAFVKEKVEEAAEKVAEVVKDEL